MGYTNEILIEILIKINWNYWTLGDSENSRKTQNWRFLDFENFEKKSKPEFICKIKDPHNSVNTGVESTMSNTCAILDAPHY
jgi:hypothetical protein